MYRDSTDILFIYLFIRREIQSDDKQHAWHCSCRLAGGTLSSAPSVEALAAMLIHGVKQVPGDRSVGPVERRIAAFLPDEVKPREVFLHKLGMPVYSVLELELPSEWMGKMENHRVIRTVFKTRWMTWRRSIYHQTCPRLLRGDTDVDSRSPNAGSAQSALGAAHSHLHGSNEARVHWVKHWDSRCSVNHASCLSRGRVDRLAHFVLHVLVFILSVLWLYNLA